MSLVSRLGSLVGVSGPRGEAPPKYRAIAPGLIVTDTEVWGWYEVRTSNSDLKGERGRDQEQDRSEHALRALVGRECHLKVLWGEVSGENYLAGLGLAAASDAAQEWAAIRADSIDDFNLPDRRVLLGVKLADRPQRTGEQAGRALGLSTERVSDAEMVRYSALAHQVGGPLRASLWKVRLASTEVLAWSITREMHRGAVIPREDTIQGAGLARLASGRFEPQSDHYTMRANDGSVAAYGTVLALTDFPEVMATPGQEWLALLGDIETSPLDATDGDGAPMFARAEASVRFVIPAARAARKQVSEARKTASEQSRSAARGSVGEPEETITVAEAELREIEFALSRRHTLLVNDHPRVIVTAATRGELEAKVTAVIGAYDEIGVTAAVMVDEQREGWLESLPGDRVRVPDLGHWRDSTALVQSWFWGGSRVGSTDPRLPAVGYTTGSTAGLVRYLATESVRQSDAPVTVFLGRTRRGKTTAMQLAMLDAHLAPVNLDSDPWSILVDTKGDADGLVNAARHYGITADLVRVGPEYAGALCGFATSDPEHAVDNVVSQLTLCLPRHLAEQATSLLQRVTASVRSANTRPATWQVVESLSKLAETAPSESLTREVGETLAAITSSGFGRLIGGKPTGSAGLPLRPGITVLQLPDLRLPEAGTPEDRWTPAQRVSVAALRGVLGWCTMLAGSRELRDRAKVVAFPEVHLLTATVDGRMYLTQAARMGAAFGLSMLLDTQDVSGIASLTGLAEGISAVFGFAQQTEQEQDALAKMLGLPVDEDTRAVIDSLDKQPAQDLDASDVATVRRGHCLYRDQSGQVATMQWTVPSPELRDLLDTSAAATAARIEDARRQHDNEGQDDDEAEVA